MAITVMSNIPKGNYNKWYSIFGQLKTARFLSNPDFNNEKHVYVHYTIESDDSRTLSDNYRRLTTNIVESKRGFWKRLKVKFGFK